MIVLSDWHLQQVIQSESAGNGIREAISWTTSLSRRYKLYWTIISARKRYSLTSYARHSDRPFLFFISTPSSEPSTSSSISFPLSSSEEIAKVGKGVAKPPAMIKFGSKKRPKKFKEEVESTDIEEPGGEESGNGFGTQISIDQEQIIKHVEFEWKQEIPT